MCQARRSIGNPPDGPVPAGVDYDMWLRPDPKQAFNPNRFLYNWRFFWDYGNSELGNQGYSLSYAGQERRRAAGAHFSARSRAAFARCGRSRPPDGVP
jgi:hypothetical protein